MDISRFLELIKKWDVEYTENCQIKRYSSIGIGPVADIAVFPKKCSDFANILSYLYLNSIRFKVVGRLTNILFTGDRFSGVIVSTKNLKNYRIDGEKVDAECGVRTSSLISELSTHSLGGLSELYGIPGSLGGMIYSNAGAYGKEIGDFVEYVAVLDLRSQAIKRLYKDELDFSYRHSAFSVGTLYLLYARLSLKRENEAEIMDSLSYYIQKRRDAQPYSERSLGSIFKRQNGAVISRLIDEAGLKGASVGDASVSQKHAGFIVNLGDATANDVISLIELIKEELKARYGVIPCEEIEII